MGPFLQMVGPSACWLCSLTYVHARESALHMILYVQQGGQRAATPAGNANTVAVAPPAERFAYLPISTPSAAAAAMRRAAAPALVPSAAGE